MHLLLSLKRFLTIQLTNKTYYAIDVSYIKNQLEFLVVLINKAK